MILVLALVALGIRGADPARAGAVAAEPRLRARREGGGRVDAADRLRRADAEHDQPHRGGLRARLLHRAAHRRRPRVPRPRRHQQDELGRRRCTGRRPTRRCCRASGGRSSSRAPRSRSPCSALVLVLAGIDEVSNPRLCRSRGACGAGMLAALVGGRGRPLRRGGARDGARRIAGRATATRRRREALARAAQARRRLRRRASRARAVDGIDLADPRGRDPRPRRRVRLRQDHGRERRPADPAAARTRSPAAASSSAGEDLLGKSAEELRRYRWRNVSMVFQSAMNALNPVMRVGDQFVDTMQRARAASTSGARSSARASCSSSSASTSGACARTRTSSPAACASA